MAYKPADLFIGVIELFGVLVPGAVFTYLHGSYVLSLAGHPPPEGELARSVAFLVGAYLSGQILLGVGAYLNGLHDWFRLPATDPAFQEVRALLGLPEAADRTDVYYRVYRHLRLHSEAAMPEIERQAADYKLFRSLAVLAVLDVVLVAWRTELPDARRIVLSLALLVVSLVRFEYLLYWTRRLTFEYYALLVKGGPGPGGPAR